MGPVCFVGHRYCILSCVIGRPSGADVSIRVWAGRSKRRMGGARYAVGSSTALAAARRRDMRLRAEVPVPVRPYDAKAKSWPSGKLGH